MPIYEYKCTDCNLRFERRQRVDEDPVRHCPSCDGSTRRVLCPVGIIFKGSGWYVTDNARGSVGGRRNGSDEPSGQAETAKDNGSKAEDHKPADKPTTK